MLLGADELFEYLLLFRFVWIRGTLGGGKTLLSVALASWLLDMGLVDGVVTNFPTILPPSLGRDDGMMYRRCVIFDEAWIMLDHRNSLVNDTTSYGGFARKFETYWIFPSVHPVDKRLRPLIIWRSGVIPLLNLWVYRWSLELEYDTGAGGWFALYNPAQVFPMYDTKHVPVDDGGIRARWERTLYHHTHGLGVQFGPRVMAWLNALERVGMSVEEAVSA